MAKIFRVFVIASALVAAPRGAGVASASGRVVGWGYNGDGQVAIPPSVDGTLGTAKAISAGWRHSCAIQAVTDAVICWGVNFGDPPASVNGTSGRARAIDAGLQHSCAIQSGTDAVVCWGLGFEGETTPPASVDGTLGGATAIAAGGFHSCAIQADSGAVVCWGRNAEGQADPPEAVDGTLGTATAIAAGRVYTCAIQAGSGAVVCWGENGDLALMPPDSVNGTAGGASAIAAGERFNNCAIRSGSGAVVCWWPDLVDDQGDTTPPASVNGTLGTAAAIAMGRKHGCAIQAGTGAVVCWGSDFNVDEYVGQATPPGSVDGTEGIASAITAGGNHSLAIRVPPREGGDVLVTDYFGGRVVRIDRHGVVETFSPPPGGTNLLVNPAGIVATPSGDVYVVDASTDRLIRIDRRSGAQHIVREPDDPFGSPSPTSVGDQPWGLDVLEDLLGTQHLYASASTGLHEATESLLLSGFQGSLVDGTLPASHFGVAVRSDGSTLDSVWVAAGPGGLWAWDGDDATALLPSAAGEWFLDVDFPDGEIGAPFFTRVEEAGFGGCAPGTGGVFTAGEGAVAALSQGGLFRCPFSLAFVSERGEIYVADAASVLVGGEGRVVKLQGSGLDWEQSLFVDAATLGVSLPAGIAYVPESINGCAGDCDGNDAVVSGELILGVNIALGSATIDQCSAFDVNDDLQVTIDELLLGVGSALDDCPPPSV